MDDGIVSCSCGWTQILSADPLSTWSLVMRNFVEVNIVWIGRRASIAAEERGNPRQNSDWNILVVQQQYNNMVVCSKVVLWGEPNESNNIYTYIYIYSVFPG
jgi:hypothetical protein